MKPFYGYAVHFFSLFNKIPDETRWEGQFVIFCQKRVGGDLCFFADNSFVNSDSNVGTAGLVSRDISNTYFHGK
jgi:hypothetical protein